MYEKPGEVPSLRLLSLYRQLVDGALGNKLEWLLQNKLALYPAAIGLSSFRLHSYQYPAKPIITFESQPVPPKRYHN